MKIWSTLRSASLCLSFLCGGAQISQAAQVKTVKQIHRMRKAKANAISATINRGLYEHIKEHYPGDFSKLAREAVREDGDRVGKKRTLWTRRRSTMIYPDKGFQEQWNLIGCYGPKKRMNILENALLKKLEKDGNTYREKSEKKVVVAAGGQKISILLKNSSKVYADVVETNGVEIKNVKVLINEEVELTNLSDSPTSTVFFGYERPSWWWGIPVVYIGGPGKIGKLVENGFYKEAIDISNRFLQIDFGPNMSGIKAAVYYNAALAYSRSGDERTAGSYAVKAKKIWEDLDKHDFVDMVSRLIKYSDLNESSDSSFDKKFD